MKGSTFLWAVVVALGICLLGGVVLLFQIRFDRGDDYPEYSSFRSDPYGSKALYEVLSEYPGIQVTRQIQGWDKLGKSKGSTLILLGVSAKGLDQISGNRYSNLNTFVMEGGQVILALNGDETWSSTPPEKMESQGGKPESATPPSPPEDQKKKLEELERKKNQTLPELWLFGASPFKEKWTDSDNQETESNPAIGPTLALRSQDNPLLPEKIAWNGAIYLESKSPLWKSIYEINSKPLILERSLGGGRVVLLAGSYLLSNEALRRSPEPQLLSWLLGSSAWVIFEETHNGIQENPGVMTLARRYQLQGFFIGLIPFLGLFLWKSTISFIPRRHKPDDRQNEMSSNRDALSGMTNLLSNYLPKKNLLETCLIEWEQSFGRQRSGSKEKLAIARSLLTQPLPQNNRNPIAQRYRQLSTMLSQQK